MRDRDYTEERTLAQLDTDLHWTEYDLTVVDRRVNYLLVTVAEILKNGYLDSLNKDQMVLLKLAESAKARIQREEKEWEKAEITPELQDLFQKGIGE